MNIKIISWNVRGLNRRAKRGVVGSLITEWKAYVYCFQETKLEGDIEEMVKQLWGNRGIKYEQLEASGTRGGIIMLWDNKVWKGEVIATGSYSLTCRFESLTQDFNWHMTGVYAPNCVNERQEVWWEIGAARGLFIGPWVVAGDFNIIKFPYEKRNCTRVTRAMTEFSDFIEDMELVDLQLEAEITHGLVGAETSSRIDRFLISVEWNDCFRNIKQEILPRVCSDHTPLILQCGNWEQTKSYFKFENWWLETEGFNDRVQNWWTSFEIEGRPYYILACKLKALKGKLKEWSNCNFGNLEREKNHILNQITMLDIIQQQRNLNQEEKARKGDKNTKFFQRVANAHKRSNNIDKLVVEVENIEEPEAIKKEIVDFYLKLYSKTEVWRRTCSMTNCPTISVEEQQVMQNPFEEEEVLRCLKLCAADKALGQMDTLWVFSSNAGRIKEKDPGMMCKLDIEKAYDHVNWDFLLGILHKDGFWKKVDQLDEILYKYC
uniref:Endonuclease/exonuclease/phosphatase domain-containing protein n=1 Tax=Nicotiana tabacum TaxID=4097 RepID=A0A1S3X8E3_TOBAC|nr:PREDICTED: uncharacterized protein LOC107762331 [Nicotiana tabacum]